jgi:hypothetical protein
VQRVSANIFINTKNVKKETTKEQRFRLAKEKRENIWVERRFKKFLNDFERASQKSHLLDPVLNVQDNRSEKWINHDS